MPTASSDSKSYWKHVQEYFGGFLKCRTDVLFLIKERPAAEQIRKKLTARSVDSAVHDDAKERAGFNLAVSAARENYVGNPALAKRRAQDALALSDSRAVESVAAIVLALSGEAREATRLSEDISKRFPEDTWVQFGSVPMIRASTFISADKAGQAVEALATASRYKLGGIGHTLNLYPVYLRGLAYLRLKRGPAAAVEFQKLSTTPAQW